MLFKKSKAVFYDKLGTLRSVTVTDEQVRFTINYSQIELKTEDIPRLLADITQLYAAALPGLERRQEEIDKAKEDTPTPEPVEEINLDDIPF